MSHFICLTTNSLSNKLLIVPHIHPHNSHLTHILIGNLPYFPSYHPHLISPTSFWHAVHPHQYQLTSLLYLTLLHRGGDLSQKFDSLTPTSWILRSHSIPIDLIPYWYHPSRMYTVHYIITLASLILMGLIYPHTNQSQSVNVIPSLIIHSPTHVYTFFLTVCIHLSHQLLHLLLVEYKILIPPLLQDANLNLPFNTPSPHQHLSAFAIFIYSFHSPISSTNSSPTLTIHYNPIVDVSIRYLC